ncbi:hypothetical protein YC2023_118967 [Brassica napus]
MASCLIPLIHAHDETLNVLSRSKSLVFFSNLKFDKCSSARLLRGKPEHPYFTLEKDGAICTRRRTFGNGGVFMHQITKVSLFHGSLTPLEVLKV